MSTTAVGPSAATAPSISAALRARREQGEAALIPYVCAGYPSSGESLALMRAAATVGADVIELGIPF
ncbi:MAG: tryptophan synthase subunit alpha, partial [Gemmatimonadota bacterium]